MRQDLTVTSLISLFSSGIVVERNREIDDTCLLVQYFEDHELFAKLFAQLGGLCLRCPS